MRSELAPFGADLLLALAGLGVLFAADLVSLRISSALAALGLAYLTGAAIVPLLLSILLVLGIPFRLVTFLLVVAACIGVGVPRMRLAMANSSPDTQGFRWNAWRSWPAETWIVIAFVVVIAAYSVIGFLSALVAPLSAWDAWSIWARKAEMLTVHSTLIHGFFASPTFTYPHPDYPLQYPIWEALHFRAAGAFDTHILLRHVWLMVVAFTWSSAYLLHRYVRAAVWAPLLVLVAVTPGVWQQLLTGYADIPLAFVACTGVISVGLWLDRQEVGLLVLAAIMLGAAANTKNEGLMAAIAVLLVAGAIVLVCRMNMRAFVFAAAGVVAALLPWRIWIAVHGIEGDMPVFRGFQPGYLLGRLDRVQPAFEAINAQLANQERWLYLLPLAALVVVVSLASGIGRRAAAFYLGAFLLIWMAFVWSYWISPHNLTWHLATSVDRIVSIPMFICAAALLHISGSLISAQKRERNGGRAK